MVYWSVNNASGTCVNHDKFVNSALYGYFSPCMTILTFENMKKSGKK